MICLNDNWMIKKINMDFSIDRLEHILSCADNPGDITVKNVRIPCQVHDALVERGIIVNPNITGRNGDVWVGESDWLYLLRFGMDDPSGVWTLHFDGLDTFVDIYLNGERIGSHNDVYLPCVAERLAMREDNLLALHFKAPRRVLDSMRFPEKYKDKVQDVSMARVFRSGFHDYCGPIPSLIRAGIYAPVRAERSSDVAIRTPIVDVELNDLLNQGSVTVRRALSGDGCETCTLTARLYDAGGKEVVCAGQIGSGDLKLEIKNPLLWWPRTHGDPNLYTLELTAGADGKVLDRVERVIGFRRVEMTGDMAFSLNGKSVRMWGANLAQPDTLSGCYNTERMNELLKLSVMGNFNCLRVWGEGEIYPDEFYDQCDRLGILLWHDFYHGYSMYSEEPEFLDLCKREAESLVSRLRHHACILLWCGGNEMFLCRDYEYPGEHMTGEMIFTSVYPEVCSRLDPGRVYRACSPWGGEYANDPTSGDTHGYTHLWHVPGSLYPVFASENCRVSTPPLRSMRRMMSDDELWPAGYTGQMTKGNPMAWPLTWCGHNTNLGHIKLGPVERFYDADDPESMIYRIGAAHAFYIKSCVERYRRGRADHETGSRRHTRGHLIWKLNNNSNIISYGVVDYFCEPMMAYYALKSAYEPLLASFSIADGIAVWLTNDTGATQKGTVEVKTFRLDSGRFVHTLEMPYNLSEDESQIIGSLDVLGQIRREHVLVAYVMDEQGNLVSRNTDYLNLERNLIFPDDARVKIRAESNGIVLTTDKFARSVELLGNNNGDEFGWMFSDNYFDLFPGEEKRVEIRGRHKEGVITAKPYYGSDISCFDRRG